jgi:REP element-mobilizing transposase RayT
MNQEPFEYGCFYHVYNRGNNKEDIFKKPENYTFFFNLIKKYLLPVADIYAYCLMKNHFHLLVKIKDLEDIAEEKYKSKPYLGFSHLFNTYTQSINKAYNRTGSLFQERLKRIRITDNNYLVQLVVYIHLNPIKHGFTTTLGYPFSSYNSIISNKITLVKRDELLSYFDDKENFMYWHDYKKLTHEAIKFLEYEDI